MHPGDGDNADDDWRRDRGEDDSVVWKHAEDVDSSWRGMTIECSVL